MTTIYEATDFNTDRLPEWFRPSGTQRGNTRWVVQHREGYRRYIRLAHAHSGYNKTKIFKGDIGFPTVPHGHLQSAEMVNYHALDQGYITEADFRYWYPRSELV